MTTPHHDFPAAHFPWERVAEMPRALYSHAAATYNGKIYVVGGFEYLDSVTYRDSNFNRSTYIFDPITLSWETAVAQKPFAVTTPSFYYHEDRHPSAITIGSSIWVLSPSAVLEYVPATDTWTSHSEIFALAAGIDPTTFSQSNYYQLWPCVYMGGNTIYVAASYSGNGTNHGFRFWSFNVSTRVWTIDPIPTPPDTIPLGWGTFGRLGSGLAYVNGWYDGSEPDGISWYWNGSTWTQLANDTPASEDQGSATSPSGHFVVIGGDDDTWSTGEGTSDRSRYLHGSSHAWAELAAITPARSDVATAVCDNWLYVLGGYAGDTYNFDNVYTVERIHFSNFDSAVAPPPPPPAAVIDTITPLTVEPLDVITITGANLGTFNRAEFPGGVTQTAINLTNGATVGTLEVPVIAKTSGSLKLYFGNFGQQGFFTYGITVNAEPILITGLNPLSTTEGSTVTIQGTGQMFLTEATFRGPVKTTATVTNGTFVVPVGAYSGYVKFDSVYGTTYQSMLTVNGRPIPPPGERRDEAIELDLGSEKQLHFETATTVNASWSSNEPPAFTYLHQFNGPQVYDRTIWYHVKPTQDAIIRFHLEADPAPDFSYAWDQWPMALVYMLDDPSDPDSGLVSINSGHAYYSSIRSQVGEPELISNGTDFKYDSDLWPYSTFVFSKDVDYWLYFVTGPQMVYFDYFSGYTTRFGKEAIAKEWKFGSSGPGSFVDRTATFRTADPDWDYDGTAIEPRHTQGSGDTVTWMYRDAEISDFTLGVRLSRKPTTIDSGVVFRLNPTDGSHFYFNYRVNTYYLYYVDGSNTRTQLASAVVSSLSDTYLFVEAIGDRIIISKNDSWTEPFWNDPAISITDSRNQTQTHVGMRAAVSEKDTGMAPSNFAIYANEVGVRSTGLELNFRFLWHAIEDPFTRKDLKRPSWLDRQSGLAVLLNESVSAGGPMEYMSDGYGRHFIAGVTDVKPFIYAHAGKARDFTSGNGNKFWSFGGDYTGRYYLGTNIEENFNHRLGDVMGWRSEIETTYGSLDEPVVGSTQLRDTYIRGRYMVSGVDADVAWVVATPTQYGLQGTNSVNNTRVFKINLVNGVVVDSWPSPPAPGNNSRPIAYFHCSADGRYLYGTEETSSGAGPLKVFELDLETRAVVTFCNIWSSLTPYPNQRIYDMYMATPAADNSYAASPIVGVTDDSVILWAGGDDVALVWKQSRGSNYPALEDVFRVPASMGVYYESQPRAIAMDGSDIYSVSQHLTYITDFTRIYSAPATLYFPVQETNDIWPDAIPLAEFESLEGGATWSGPAVTDYEVVGGAIQNTGTGGIAYFDRSSNFGSLHYSLYAAAPSHADDPVMLLGYSDGDPIYVTGTRIMKGTETILWFGSCFTSIGNEGYISYTDNRDGRVAISLIKNNSSFQVDDAKLHGTEPMYTDYSSFASGNASGTYISATVGYNLYCTMASFYSGGYYSVLTITSANAAFAHYARTNYNLAQREGFTVRPNVSYTAAMQISAHDGATVGKTFRLGFAWFDGYGDFLSYDYGSFVVTGTPTVQSVQFTSPSNARFGSLMWGSPAGQAGALFKMSKPWAGRTEEYAPTANAQYADYAHVIYELDDLRAGPYFTDTTLKFFKLYWVPQEAYLGSDESIPGNHELRVHKISLTEREDPPSGNLLSPADSTMQVWDPLRPNISPGPRWGGYSLNSWSSDDFRLARTDEVQPAIDGEVLKFDSPVPTTSYPYVYFYPPVELFPEETVTLSFWHRVNDRFLEWSDPEYRTYELDGYRQYASGGTISAQYDEGVYTGDWTKQTIVVPPLPIEWRDGPLSEELVTTQIYFRLDYGGLPVGGAIYISNAELSITGTNTRPKSEVVATFKSPYDNILDGGTVARMYDISTGVMGGFGLGAGESRFVDRMVRFR